MKKILLVLSLVAATVFAAKAQTTVLFPNAGPAAVTNATFDEFSGSLPSPNVYQRARLLIAVTGFDFGAGNVAISGVTLSGQGLTGTRSINFPTTITANADNGYDPILDPWNPEFISTYTASSSILLNSSPAVWNSTNNLAAFTATFGGGASALPGARVYYAVQYANNAFSQLNTAYGSFNLVAVPEPSTYAAAAGLLALFLWSSRRHLFKLAGARSSASGSGENGAA